jgi:hypothetical protein
MDLNYHSGDDFLVEFLDYRYGFSRTDFTQRVVAAAIRLELVPQRDLSEAEAADLVELASGGRVALDRLHSEPLSYWLRKLIFRGAWIDHRIKAGLLDIAFDEASGGFTYRMPSDQAPVLEMAPVPSWGSLAYVTE